MGSVLYVIESGHYTCFHNDGTRVRFTSHCPVCFSVTSAALQVEVVAQLSSGSFGELAVMHQSARNITVTCVLAHVLVQDHAYAFLRLRVPLALRRRESFGRWSARRSDA
jgi:hypothetical protein